MFTFERQQCVEVPAVLVGAQDVRRAVAEERVQQLHLEQ